MQVPGQVPTPVLPPQQTPQATPLLVEHAPTVTAAPIAATEDTAHHFTLADFGFADLDSSDTLHHVTITGLPTAAQGQLLLNGLTVTANQQITAADIPHLTFQPTANFNGEVPFKYTVSDGHADSTEATGHLTVQAVNDAPTVTAVDSGNAAEIGATNEDVAKTLSEADLLRLVGASDVDHDTLHVSAISIDPQYGNFAKDPATGDWTFTPASNFDGTHLPLTVEISDGTATTTAHAQLDVTPVADTPSLSLSLGAVPLTTHTDSNVQLVNDVTVSVAGGPFQTYGGDPTVDFAASRVAIASPDGVDPHLITGLMVDGVPVTGAISYVNTGVGQGVVFEGFSAAAFHNAHEVTLTFADAAPHSMNWKLIPDMGGDFNSLVNFMDSSATVNREVSSGPAVSYQVAQINEDTDIPLVITASSPDSSETLSITVSGLPQGAALSAGTANPDGSWTLTPAQLTGLHITPPADWSGEMRLGVTATSTDGTDTATTTSDLRITVTPVAETPTLTASGTDIDEDAGAIALNIQLGGHLDASETRSITIAGVPTGATLSAGTRNADGSWSLTPAQLSGLTVTPEAQWSGTMPLRITATSTEATGESATATTSLNIHVNPVMDMTMAAQDVTVAPANLGTGIALPLQLSSVDTDEVARVSFHIPKGWSVTGASAAPSDYFTVSGAVASDNQWTLTLAELANAKLVPPAGFTGALPIAFHVEAVDGSVTVSKDLSSTVTVAAPGITIDSIDNALEVQVDSTGGHQIHGAQNPGGQGKWTPTAYETTSGDVTIHGSATGLADGTQVTVHLSDRLNPTNSFDLVGTVTGGQWSVTIDHTQVSQVGDHDWQVKATATDTAGTVLHATTEIIDQGLVTASAHEGGAATSLDLLEGADGLTVSNLLYSTDGQHYSSQLPDGFVLAADGHTLQLDPANPAYDHLAHGDVQQIFVKYDISETVGTATQTVHQLAQINISGANDAPTVTVAPIAATEDVVHTFSVADFGFTDVDAGDTLHQVTINTLPNAAQGQLLLNGQAVTAGQQIAAADIPTLTFQPVANFNGDVAFRYTVNDGRLDSAEVSGTLVVHAVDDMSTVDGDDQVSITEGAAASSHPDLTVQKGAWLAAGPDHNTLPVVTDGDPNTGRWYSSGGATLHIPGTSDTLDWPSGFWLINMGNPNYGFHGWQLFPMGGTAATAQFTGVPISAEGDLQIHDVDATSATFTEVHDAAGNNGYGTFSIDAAGHWTFVSNAKAEALPDGQTAQETFTFQTTDGATHTVTLSITGSDTASHFEGDISGKLTESATGATVSAQGTLTIIDPNTGQTPTLPDLNNVASDNGYGHFSMQGGHWVYELDPAASDWMQAGIGYQDQITIRASDGTTQVIVINITGTNDAPRISGSVQLADSTPDTPVTLTTADLLANASDPDLQVRQGVDEQLSIHNLSVDAAAGTVVDNGDGTFTFTPKAGFTGQATFSYQVHDEKGGVSDATAELDIGAPNAAPTVTADAAHAADLGATSEDTAKTYTEAELLKLAGATDADGDTLSVSGVTVDAQYGSFARNAAGDWVFTPAANVHGNDIPLTVTVSDGRASTDAHATLDVSSVTDAPTLAVSIDNLQSSIQPVTGSQNVYMENCVATHTGSDQISDLDYILSKNPDQMAFLTRGPVVGPGFDPSLITGVMIDGQVFSGQLQLIDSDGNGEWDGLAFQGLGNDVYRNAHSLSFIFKPDAAGDAELTIKAALLEPLNPVNGGLRPASSGVWASEDLHITRASVVDVIEDRQLTVMDLNITVAAADPADPVQAVTVSGIPADSTLSAGQHNADGSWTLTPAELAGLKLTLPPDWTGDLQIDVAATTGSGAQAASSQGSASTTVAPVADDLAMAGKSWGVAIEDSTLTVSDKLDITDADTGSAATIAEQSNTAGKYGTFSIQADGTWTYHLDNSNPAVQSLRGDRQVTDTFEITVQDGAGHNLTRHVNVIVEGSHDQPVVDVHVAVPHTSLDAISRGTITGDTDMSAVHVLTQQQTDALSLQSGTRIVGLYAPGSADNLLSGIAHNDLPVTNWEYYTTSAYTSGYVYLKTTGQNWNWFGTHIGGDTTRFHSVYIDDKSKDYWEGGIVVFENGMVGHLQRVCDGTAHADKWGDYIYFNALDGVNANTGATLLQGSGTAGEHIDVFDEFGGKLGSATVGANGQWAISRCPPMSAGEHVLDVWANGNCVQHTVMEVDSQGHGVPIHESQDGIYQTTEVLGTTIEDDPNHHALSGQITLTDADAGDHPAVTADTSRGKYGTFTIDAQGHWQYTLDNSRGATQGLGAGDLKTETFTIEVHTDSGETVEKQVVVGVRGVAEAGHDAAEQVQTYDGADLVMAPNPMPAPEPDPALSPLDDYLQYADTSAQDVGADGTADGATTSPLDDYLAAAGVDAGTAKTPDADLPPTEVLIDLAHPVDPAAAPADDTVVDDTAQVVIPPDTLDQPQDDQQQHGV